MRPFEISLFLLVIVFIIYLSIRKKSKSKNIEIIGFSLIILLHFILESYRWQMIPLYFLSFIILISIYKNYRLLNGKLFVKLFKTVSILLILLIGYYLPTALPIFELPKTNGKYFVGSSYIHLKTKREETITKNAIKNV